MPFIYDLGLRTYATALKVAGPFHTKAQKWTEGQKKLLELIRRRMKFETSPVAWFHCASLGEFEQGRPLIEAIRKEYPAYKICLTFFSPSGYEIRKNYPGADFVFYLPLDTPANARAFLNLVKPRLAVFVKYEFWHHYLHELRQRQIPTLSVSAIFRPGQFFFSRFGGFYRNMLRQFTHLFVQNSSSAHLLAGIGITNCSVAGDTRFDRVARIPDTAPDIPLAEAFANGADVMVIGSCWPQDMVHLQPLVEAHKELKFIIAPHEIHESEIEDLKKRFNGEAGCYTQTTVEKAPSLRVLIIDTVGLLSALYRYGRYAYVGGAFGKGLHNTLEAATFGLPVFFGPNYHKFQEACDLIEHGAGISVSNTAELEAALHKLQASAEDYAAASVASKTYVNQHTGATSRIMNYIHQQLPH